MCRLLALLSILIGCRGDPAAGLAEIAAWQADQPVPDVELVDQRGEPFRLARYRGAHLLVGFVYTRCDVAEACPMTAMRMRAVQDAWSGMVARGETGGNDLQLLAITLDPGHDTPERLQAYAEAQGADPARWTVATGPEGLVDDALPTLFNVLVLPDGRGGVQHTVKLVLIGPDGRIEAEWKDDAATVDAIVAAAAR